MYTPYFCRHPADATFTISIRGTIATRRSAATVLLRLPIPHSHFRTLIRYPLRQSPLSLALCLQKRHQNLSKLKCPTGCFRAALPFRKMSTMEFFMASRKEHTDKSLSDLGAP